jgi:hypothetical protein
VKQGWLKPEAVRALTGDSQTASRNARRIWNLFVLDVWLQVHKRPAPPRETLSELLGQAALV